MNLFWEHVKTFFFFFFSFIRIYSAFFWFQLCKKNIRFACTHAMNGKRANKIFRFSFLIQSMTNQRMLFFLFLLFFFFSAYSTLHGKSQKRNVLRFIFLLLIFCKKVTQVKRYDENIFLGQLSELNFFTVFSGFQILDNIFCIVDNNFFILIKKFQRLTYGSGVSHNRKYKICLISGIF